MMQNFTEIGRVLSEWRRGGRKRGRKKRRKRKKEEKKEKKEEEMKGKEETEMSTRSGRKFSLCQPGFLKAR